jgi:hypothetical protein
VASNFPLEGTAGSPSLAAAAQRYVTPNWTMFADIPLWFVSLILITAVASGATASIVGFGIGSLLTPVFAVQFGIDIAVAVVALPHLAGGLLRGWRLRGSVDRGFSFASKP